MTLAEPGKTYDCVVKGQRVTVRVAPGSVTQPASCYDESDVMLDPWCDLPSQGKRIPVNVRIGQLPLHIPEIPQDDE